MVFQAIAEDKLLPLCLYFRSGDLREEIHRTLCYSE